MLKDGIFLLLLFGLLVNKCNLIHVKYTHNTFYLIFPFLRIQFEVGF